MIVGKYVCANCGQDCTPPAHLWGFGLMIRGTLNPSQQREIEALKVKYGQGEFIFCWECAAKAMGAKTLAEKDEETKRPQVAPAERTLENACCDSAPARREGDINGSNDR